MKPPWKYIHTYILWSNFFTRGDRNPQDPLDPPLPGLWLNIRSCDWWIHWKWMRHRYLTMSLFCSSKSRRCRRWRVRQLWTWRHNFNWTTSPLTSSQGTATIWTWSRLLTCLWLGRISAGVIRIPTRLYRNCCCTINAKYAWEYFLIVWQRDGTINLNPNTHSSSNRRKILDKKARQYRKSHGDVLKA